MLRTEAQSVEDLEIDLLLEGVFRRFDHDFRGYQRELVRSKLHMMMQLTGIRTVSALQDRIMHDSIAAKALLHMLCAKPRALFDDPAYFLALREVVIPWLRSCPSPRIWIAECVAAEDVYALAILLAEEGVYDKTQLFATAINQELLENASKGCFSSERWQQYEKNYRDSGGKTALASYCSSADSACRQLVFSAELRSNITWAQYSLVTDASFNEFELIMCRRILSEFGLALRRRVLQLFYDSMPMFGILGIDREDGLEGTPFNYRYTPVSAEQGLYRRVA